MIMEQECESVFHCWVQKPGTSAVTVAVEGWRRDAGKSASSVPRGSVSQQEALSVKRER